MYRFRPHPCGRFNDCRDDASRLSLIIVSKKPSTYATKHWSDLDCFYGNRSRGRPIIENSTSHTKALESDTSSRQCYSKRRTEKLITPDAKTERPVRSLGRPYSRYFPKNPKLPLRSRNPPAKRKLYQALRNWTSRAAYHAYQRIQHVAALLAGAVGASGQY